MRITKAFCDRHKTADSILPFMREMLEVENPWRSDLAELKACHELMSLSPEARAIAVVDATRLLASVVPELEKEIGVGGNASWRANHSLQWLIKELLRRAFRLPGGPDQPDAGPAGRAQPLLVGDADHFFRRLRGASRRRKRPERFDAQSPDGCACRPSAGNFGGDAENSSSSRFAAAQHHRRRRSAARTQVTRALGAIRRRDGQFAFRGSKKSLVARSFDVARRAPGSAPSAKWLKQARELLAAIGPDSFKQHLIEWMKLASKGVIARNPFTGDGECEVGLDTENADVLKGLIWAAASLDDAALAEPIGDFAEACYKKLKYVGPRCAKAGNACVAALAAMTSEAPASQLSRLNQRVKQPTGKKMAAKGINKFADRAGLTPAEMEERVVPTYGLSADGAHRDQFGDFTVTARIVGPELEIAWQGPDKKSRQSVPAAVKKDHPAELKQLQAIFKQIDSALPVQRDRIERSILQDRTWPLEQWRQYYVDHPLVGSLARRLIWTVKDVPVLPQADSLTDVSGKSIKAAPSDPIRLWHPINRSPQEVLAWRQRLEALQIIQPFKQAHREIYVLTDAERATGTYSNRFAAHILRQHQFAALAQQRGWTYRLMGKFDSHNTPTISLPSWNTKVEFWVEQIDDGEFSQAGVSVHVATDQVRFHRIDPPAQLSLADVQPLLFSELMRDVDLFVGVASVANDPTWQDGGPGGTFRHYWQEYSFGDLSETAKTRRAVLETLLPRLTKLKDRWTLGDRFLTIRGELRTYKIHLGSGNILMEPNDQYLCIVPGRSAAGSNDSIFLPFEGDNTLSVILSKAFLLAADKSIDDPTITRQLTLG